MIGGISKIIKRKVFGWTSHMTRQDWMVVSIFGLIFSLIFITLFDGYVFYTGVVQTRQRLSIGGKTINLNARTVDGLIGILNTRQSKFEEVESRFGPLLPPVNPPPPVPTTTTATSTPFVPDNPVLIR